MATLKQLHEFWSLDDIDDATDWLYYVDAVGRAASSGDGSEAMP